MIFIVLNFTLSGVMLCIGNLSPRKAGLPNEWGIFASLLFLFGLHQFDQGLPWLELFDTLDAKGLNIIAALFVCYVQVVPALQVPVTIWLLQARRPKRILLGGAPLSGFSTRDLLNQPVQVFEHASSLVYANAVTARLWIASVSILTACGSLILRRSPDHHPAVRLDEPSRSAGRLLYILAKGPFSALVCDAQHLHCIEQRIVFLVALRCSAPQT